MYFEPGNRYLLTNIESESHNPLHEQLIGRLCELVSFRLNNFGYFKVDIDGKFHRIHTSDIRDVDASDFANEITVTTRNSVYTFAKVSDPYEREVTPDA